MLAPSGENVSGVDAAERLISVASRPVEPAQVEPSLPVAEAEQRSSGRRARARGRPATRVDQIDASRQRELEVRSPGRARRSTPFRRARRPRQPRRRARAPRPHDQGSDRAPPPTALGDVALGGTPRPAPPPATRSLSSTSRASAMSCSRFFGFRSRQRRSSRRIAGGVAAGSARSRSRCVSTPASVSRHRVATEQLATGEHLVEHDAERPDVGALVDRHALAPARAPCTPRCRGSSPAASRPASTSATARASASARAAADASPPPDPSPSPARSRGL